MDTYIVTYEEIFPGAMNRTKEELTKTAIVLAGSFDEAQRKVESRFKKEMERVKVLAIALNEDTTMIV